MTDRPTVLPPSLPPRLLSRDQAAEYCGGISVGLFDSTIAKEVPPIELHKRRLWDIRALDHYLDVRSGLAIKLRPIEDGIAQLGKKPARKL